MLARGGNREAFMQTRARWEAVGEPPSGSRTLPSRGRRARLRRSDSRDSLDDGRPSRDSPPPPPTDALTDAETRRTGSAANMWTDPTAAEPTADSSRRRRGSRTQRRQSSDARSPDRDASGGGGRRRLSRTPSLCDRERPAAWLTERPDQESAVPGDDAAEYRPSSRAALGIGADWGGSLNRRRMPRRETALGGGGGGGVTGFQLPAVISGRLARQSEFGVSSSPDLTRELFASPTEGRGSPRPGRRRDLDEILERAARRRSSRLAAGGAPLLSARALFAAEPRSAGRADRADSADRWERGGWERQRRDSDTSEASSAAAGGGGGGPGPLSSRSSSSGAPEWSDRPPASPLAAERLPAVRRAGFRRRVGSADDVLDAPDPPGGGGGGGTRRGAGRGWLGSLGAARSAELADDATETSSVSSGGAERRSVARDWLAQALPAAEDAADETASIGSGGGGGGWRSSPRGWLSRGSAAAELSEDTAGRPPAGPPSALPEESSLASLPSRSVAGRSEDSGEIRPRAVVTDGSSVGSAERASRSATEDDDHGAGSETIPAADRPALLRQKLSALRADKPPEREDDQTPTGGGSTGSEHRVSRLRQKAAPTRPDESSEVGEAADTPASESRADLLRKKLAALTPTAEGKLAGMKADRSEETLTAPQPQESAADAGRAAALRQKIVSLRPNTLNLSAADEAGDRPAGGDSGRVRSPLTARRGTVTPGGGGGGGGGGGTPPVTPRPRSALRRTASGAGGSPERRPAAGGSPWRSRSRSPVKGRITTLRLKPRRVSQSPDPLARWRSVDDGLAGSPVAAAIERGLDAIWAPQGQEPRPPATATPTPTRSAKNTTNKDDRERDEPAAGTATLPPPRPPRRRRSRTGDPAPKEPRVDENRNQLSPDGSTGGEVSASPPPPPGEEWLVSLAAHGWERLSSASSCGSLNSIDLERELLSAEEPAQAVPRQLTAVKSDLIAFSPGKESPEPPPPAAHQQQQQRQRQQPATAVPAADDGEATPANLTAPTTAAAGAEDANLRAQLKKQELYFQDLLLKQDREMTAMKNSMVRLKQQATNNQTAKVAASLEAMAAQLAAEKEHLRSQLSGSVQRLTVERDEARQEVANAEAMFADLHRKYEKAKALMKDNRRSAEQNDNVCRGSQEQVSRERQRYDMLQQYAEDKLASLRSDMEAEEKARQAELLTLRAKLQLTENREAKLERENKEITAICDELIQKMGSAR